MKQIIVALLALSLLSISNVSFAASNGFCDSKGQNSLYFWQQSITVGGSNIISANNGGYNYSESTGISLPQGSSNIELTPGYRSYKYPVYWRGWLDLNGDKQFTEDEQLFEATSQGPITVPITVNSPPDTDSSTLRIAMKYGSYPEPCEIYYYGETEDLTVSIQQASSQPSALEDNYHLTADHDFTLHRTGSIGDRVYWVVELNGVISLKRLAASEIDFLYYINQQGADIRIWLEEFINGSYQRVSNIIEYTPGTTDQYELSLAEGFQIIRSGQIGDSLTWVIEQDGKTVLERIASSELEYVYFNNSVSSKYRVWLKQFINGQYETVSNTLEYEVGQTEFTLTLDQLKHLRRNGQPGDQVSWVIEQDGQIVLQRNASNEMTFSYFNNTPGSTYRVWLQMYLNGQYQVVSNIVEYAEPALYDYTLSLGSGYEITRSGNLGDPVAWVIEEDGKIVLERNASKEMIYTYNGNRPGSTYRVWLKQFVNGKYEIVSKVASYSIPVESNDFELTMGADYAITRNGVLGDKVNWVIIIDGKVVLKRVAANELTYTYYRNYPGSTIYVYLEKFIGSSYQQVSNTLSYTVQ